MDPFEKMRGSLVLNPISKVTIEFNGVQSAWVCDTCDMDMERTTDRLICPECGYDVTKVEASLIANAYIDSIRDLEESFVGRRGFAWRLVNWLERRLVKLH